MHFSNGNLHLWQSGRLNLTEAYLGYILVFSSLNWIWFLIINMSSTSAVGGYPHFAAYGATKAAVRNLTVSTAVYCQTNGFPIRCNSVHPDGIFTDMITRMQGNFPEMDPDKGARAMEFACEPAAVADVICFLASHGARHINGAEIRVDNSSTVQVPYFWFLDRYQRTPNAKGKKRNHIGNARYGVTDSPFAVCHFPRNRDTIGTTRATNADVPQKN